MYTPKHLFLIELVMIFNLKLKSVDNHNIID